MGTVVVGYVPTPEGEAALARAIDEARLRDSTLVIVSSHRGGQGYDRSAADKADADLAAVETRLAGTGVSYEVRQLVRGLAPAEDVVGVAEEIAADLIVIGLRRRSPVGKLVLGSNAQRLLLDAPCPVLAVKAD
ncbi:universal stress protein [Nocardioides sp. SYSU DS0663]|uniref:universal stress protein n=1 Tax=Nocardioides sp. SYSU DS0663 TaxID=3416445 RepID=UPI003F4C9DD4